MKIKRDLLEDELDKANRELREFEESMKILEPYMRDHPERTVGEALDVMEKEGRHSEVTRVMEYAARNPMIQVPRLD